MARDLAADATKAIQFVNSHQGTLWMPEYRNCTRSIAQKAGELTRLLDHYDEFGWLDRKDLELRQILSAQ